MRASDGVRQELENVAKMIVQALVDDQNSVRVLTIGSANATVMELTVAKGDVGKVIGKQGRIADAMRTLLSAIGAKGGTRLLLEIIEP